MGFSSPHFTLRALQGQQPVRLRFFGSTPASFFGRGMARWVSGRSRDRNFAVLCDPLAVLQRMLSTGSKGASASCGDGGSDRSQESSQAGREAPERHKCYATGILNTSSPVCPRSRRYDQTIRVRIGRWGVLDTVWRVKQISRGFQTWKRDSVGRGIGLKARVKSSRFITDLPQ